VSETLLVGLRGLPKGQREVVVLKLFQGRAFAEIALRLGISEEACRMRLSRGLATLRDHLEAEGVEP
jgi:RNA polymerase sigma factor (sigma-70 family)